MHSHKTPSKFHSNIPSCNTNDEIIIRIKELSRSGAGISKEPSGKTIFIPFSAPGDLLKVRILKKKKRYSEGKILEILDPSPMRLKPRCPAFGTCGGCQWQHLPYPVQWDTKVKGVLHILSQIGVAPIPKLDLIPAKKVWEYRNRIQLHGQLLKKEKELGFFKSQTNTLIPVNRCDLARPEINAAWEEIRNLSKEKSHEGLFKVEIEVFPDKKIKKTWNKPHSASGFRQVHDDQNEKLQFWIKSLFMDTQASGSVLFDLFGGSGNLSLPLLNQVEKIHCVDIHPPHLSLKKLPPSFQFHQSPVLNWLLKQCSGIQKENWDKKKWRKKSAILDPPRGGLGESLHAISKALETLGFTELIIIGCTTDPWVKDLSHWLKKWNLEKILLIDFFPQTFHIECIAHLKR